MIIQVFPLVVNVIGQGLSPPVLKATGTSMALLSAFWRLEVVKLPLGECGLPLWSFWTFLCHKCRYYECWPDLSKHHIIIGSHKRIHYLCMTEISILSRQVREGWGSGNETILTKKTTTDSLQMSISFHTIIIVHLECLHGHTNNG